MSSNVVGIDIGTGGVRGVEVAHPGKPKASVVRYHAVALPEGAVVRGEVVEPNTVAGALKQLWAQGGFKSKNVVLGMGNHRVLSRDLTMPRASLAHIRESLPYQVQDMLPIPLEDALLDFYPVAEGEGESGPVVSGLLIAAVREAVKGNVRAVELAGLLPLDVDLMPFALTRVLNLGDRLPGTVVQVDVGAATTSIVVTTDGVPQFVRLVPAGGDDVTRALVDRLAIARHEADRLKRTLGMNAAQPLAATAAVIKAEPATEPLLDPEHQPQIPLETGLETEAKPESEPAEGQQAERDKAALERDAVSVIREVTGELLSSVRNTANYFTNTRHTSISRIVLTGGGAQLPGFAEGLAALTHLPVAPAEISRMVGYSRSVNPADLRGSQSSFLVALGLALGSAA